MGVVAPGEKKKFVMAISFRVLISLSLVDSLPFDIYDSCKTPEPLNTPKQYIDKYKRIGRRNATCVGVYSKKPCVMCSGDP